MDIYYLYPHGAGRQGTPAQRHPANDLVWADWRWGLRIDKETFLPIEGKHQDACDLSTSISSSLCRLLN